MRETDKGGSWTFGTMRGAERLPPAEVGNDTIDRYTLEMQRRKKELEPVNNFRSRWEAWEMRWSNLLAELRRMENDLAALLHQEKKDPVLAEVGKQIREEILANRRRYGRNNNLESRLLSEVLFHIKEPEPSHERR